MSVWRRYKPWRLSSSLTGHLAHRFFSLYNNMHFTDSCTDNTTQASPIFDAFCSLITFQPAQLRIVTIWFVCVHREEARPSKWYVLLMLFEKSKVLHQGQKTENSNFFPPDTFSYISAFFCVCLFYFQQVFCSFIVLSANYSIFVRLLTSFS